MSNANKLKVTMLFPVYDNEGVPIEREIWRWWVREIRRIFSEGGTDFGLVTGWWHGQSDLNRFVWAIADEDNLSDIRPFLERAKDKFRQGKMYFEYHPTTYEEVG